MCNSYEMRHLLVFCVVYAVLVYFLPQMERELWLGVKPRFSVYAKLQNVRHIRINFVKGACLLCIWPFMVHAGPRIFVEMGGFSMACFAIACSSDRLRVERATSKLFWHSLFLSADVPTPRLIALCDQEGRARLIDTSLTKGVRKPDRGMYGVDVRRQTTDEFIRTPKACDILQEEIQSTGRAGETYRISTFRCARGTRIISVFLESLRNASIPASLWERLIQFARRHLVPLHAFQLMSLPLIGWDIIHTRNDTFVVLEGNPGGSGSVNAGIAATWVSDLREAHALGIYDGFSI
jgi:hypothetical protein